MYFIGTLWKYDFTLIWYHWFQGVATYEIMWRIHLAHQTSAMIREWWLSHLKVADDIRMSRGSNSNPHKNFYLLCIVKMQEKYSKESQRNPRIINSSSSKVNFFRCEPIASTDCTNGVKILNIRLMEDSNLPMCCHLQSTW